MRRVVARGRAVSQRRRAGVLVRFCHWLRRPMPEWLAKRVYWAAARRRREGARVK